MKAPSGSFAEYAIAWETTSFHLPNHISFEEAATIPLAAMTAAVGRFYYLGLPKPWEKCAASLAREKSKGGVVVWNAAGAVGAFAVKLLAWANIHPIIAVAGAGIPFVEIIIDRAKGGVLLDYRQGPEDLAAAIQSAMPQGRKLCYAFDAVSEKGSYETISRVLSPDDDSHLSLVLPITNDKEITPSINRSITMVGSVHGDPDDLRDFGFCWFRLFGQGLKQGWLSAHPYEVVSGRLNGLETSLRNLQDGKASATEYLCRISDTPGLLESQNK